jgi:hypothetical protein
MRREFEAVVYRHESGSEVLSFGKSMFVSEIK